MDHGEETNPVRGDKKSLMEVGVKHKLVLKTDHLGWGPSTALLRAQNVTENLLANYRPPDLFCGEAFSGCGKRE